MQAVVNHRYKYIMLYSAKAGCTSMRTLYLEVHKHELSATQLEQLDSYHNLNELLPYQEEVDYDDYYKFCISRNPYARVVSAFLDQYAYAQNQGVLDMLAKVPPLGDKPKSFIAFLQYVQSVPDADRDSHFQTQSYFFAAKKPRIKKFFQRASTDFLTIDDAGDISGFDAHLTKVYRKVFRYNQGMLKRALGKLSAVEKLNPSFYCKETVDQAAKLNLQELDELVFAPKPQDFFLSELAQQLVQEIYAEDFSLFGYDINKIPHKSASSELDEIPADFDWETYLLLGPDLVLDGIVNQRKVMRHYLEFGRFETDRRPYKVEAPEGFDWRKYLDMYDDIALSGIDNEREAIIHYLAYGRNEGRAF